MGGTGPVPCEGFLVLGGLVPIFWWMDLGLVSLRGSVMSNSMFWGTYRFGMALGSFSILGAVLCSYFAECLACIQHWSLLVFGAGVEGVGLCVEMEALGEVSSVNISWVRSSLVAQSPGFGSPTLEFQALHLTIAPSFHRPHSTEGKTPQLMVKRTLNSQEHLSNSHTKRKEEGERRIKI